MNFTKMHGAGNDFIIIEDLHRRFSMDALSRIAATLCRRRLSIGADGLMVVVPAQADGDFRMLFFNADGSVGEMCGNGARCIARYGYEHGFSGETQKIETTAGLVTGQRIDTRQYRIRLNDPTCIDDPRTVSIDGISYACGYMELGNPGLPHAIVQLENFDQMDENELLCLGQKLRWNAAFPKGANVTFCYPDAENSVVARTFERGVEGFTLACGTGCGCTASILCLRGAVSGQNTRIRMPGGDLFVTLTRTQDGGIRDIFLTGPTNIVAEGTIRDEDLIL
jgi:diaminopimelate epimerase